MSSQVHPATEFFPPELSEFWYGYYRAQVIGGLSRELLAAGVLLETHGYDRGLRLVRYAFDNPLKVLHVETLEEDNLAKWCDTLLVLSFQLATSAAIQDRPRSWREWTWDWAVAEWEVRGFDRVTAQTAVALAHGTITQ